VAVDGKSNEITGFRPLLEEVDLEGAVVTADALHCQRDHARYLVGERHADYLFVAKANQPGLVAAISRLPEQAFSPSERDRGVRRGSQPGADRQRPAGAGLRNLVIGLLRLAGQAEIARALRWIARNPARALALLGV
jgi:predicted transposase YbfD/YdcC